MHFCVCATMTPMMDDSVSLNRHLLRLVLLFVALVAVAFFAWLFTPTRPVPAQQQAVRTPPPPPALTPDRTTAAIGSKSFASLVSYTDQGFEPKEVTLAKGDTIRFTNNSTRPMLLVSDVSTTQEMKDVLPPGEYAEFTFTKSGDKHFSEKDHSTMTALIHVK